MSLKRLATIAILITALSSLAIYLFRPLFNAPKVGEPTPSSTPDKQIQHEDEIINFLLQDKYFAWKTKPDSRNFCVLDSFSDSDSLFPLSLWIRCGEFSFDGVNMVELSGMSMPILLNYPNELSYFDPTRFSYQKPGDGALYKNDVLKIFPSTYTKRILNYDTSEISKKLKGKAADYYKIESTSKEVTLTGKSICLSHKDTTGPQTLECAYGFIDEDGKEYVLKDPSFTFIPKIEMNKSMIITGTYKERQNEKYRSVGEIEIKSIKYK